MRLQPVLRAIEVSHAACKYEFRRILHLTADVFSFYNISSAQRRPHVVAWGTQNWVARYWLTTVVSSWSRQPLGVFDLPGYDFTMPFESVGVTNDIYVMGLI